MLLIINHCTLMHVCNINTRLTIGFKTCEWIMEAIIIIIFSEWKKWVWVINWPDEYGKLEIELT